MRLILLTFLLLTCSLYSFGQKTKVYGKVLDAKSKKAIDLARIGFVGSEISTLSNDDGSFLLETYYASDTLVVSCFGYQTYKQKIQIDKAQEVLIYLEEGAEEIEGVVIRMTGDSPAIRILKRIIRNKPINNKEKLESYDYELYNKVQIDMNNIGKELESSALVKKLDFVLEYLDSNDREGKVLPILLSENVSDFYFKKNPPAKRDITKATRVSGMENLQFNQLFGDIFMDINIYDNYIDLFSRSFVSPIANNGRSFYNYSLIDSMYIDNHFYFKINFKPKRTGDATFEGTMLIHDTTFAVKSISADLSNVANINFINGMYFEQHFDQVQDEVWMLTNERLIIDFKLARESKLMGFFMRKSSNRYNFNINKPQPDKFYNSKSTLEELDGARNRSVAYWDSIRHVPLTQKEANIDVMLDTLNKNRTFKFYKNVIFLASTGYYPIKKVEIGDLYSFIGTNPVEKFRMNVALRTSNEFSKVIELGGKIGYGFYDKKIKGGVLIRINTSRTKRGQLKLYANSDIEQYGSGSAVSNMFGNLLRFSKLDKLFYVNKTGFFFEQDIGKDFILSLAGETKQLRSLGLVRFEYIFNNQVENIHILKTTEFTIDFSWGKDRQFISGVYNRTSIGSRYPILSINATFGIKGILGSQYNYQRIAFALDHKRNVGALGRIQYGFEVGKYFGNTPFPFLQIHPGSISYWFSKESFNKMNLFEFISDTYATAYLEHHFQGLIFDRIPGIKKLQWRLVAHGKMAWGMLNQSQNNALIIPTMTRQFGKTPYVEFGVGIENIFKFFRVDFIYRATHIYPGMKPFGVRLRFDIVI